MTYPSPSQGDALHATTGCNPRKPHAATATSPFERGANQTLYTIPLTTASGMQPIYMPPGFAVHLSRGNGCRITQAFNI